MIETRIELETFPDAARADVQRGAKILEEQLAELSAFDIEAHWRFGFDSNGQAAALVDLTTPYDDSRFGVTDYPYPLAGLTEGDLTVRRRLSTQIGNFTHNLSDLIRRDLKKLRKGLAEMAPVGGE